MIYVLVKVKCNLQLNAIILMIAFLFPFITKSIGDGLRVYAKSIDAVQSTVTLTVFISEHVRTLIMIYLVFIVHDVRAKIESRDVAQYIQYISKINNQRRVAYIAVIIVSILQTFSYAFRAFRMF
jgi:hypothetical protein